MSEVLHCVGVNYRDEVRLERGSSYKKAVNVSLASKFVSVGWLDRTTVNDASGFCYFRVDVSREPCAKGCVDFLGLLRGSNLSGSNGPDRLVGNNYIAPVCDGGGNGGELALVDLNSLPCLALFEQFADASYNGEALGNGVRRLIRDNFISLLENGTAFGMSGDHPWDSHIDDHVGGDLAGEGSGASVAIL